MCVVTGGVVVAQLAISLRQMHAHAFTCFVVRAGMCAMRSRGSACASTYELLNRLYYDGIKGIRVTV